jgi:hypothetical protein
MMTSEARVEGRRDIADAVARELVATTHRPDGSYMRTPLVYPSGANVVVRIDGGPSKFFVSDFGFGYQEAEMMGGSSVFMRHARSIAETAGVGFDQHAFFVLEVSRDQLAGAVTAVANCSNEAVLVTFYRLSDKAIADSASALYERLVTIFPRDAVARDAEVVGSSNTKWHVSSLVKVRSRNTIFDVVSKHPISIAFTSTKFQDIKRLECAPNRVAVVTRKADLKTYLGVLSQAANVIEKDAPDETLERLAEAA